jgi:hypothetical protein
MFAFTKGATQEGTMQSAAAAPPAAAPAPGPPRPPAIPEHYVFDTEVELWMPPSAVAKAATAVVPAASDSGLTVYKSSEGGQPAPYVGNANDPICFEFTNTGTCGRLARGEICRYRHLEATHPEVIADRVRQGKLPPTALAAANAGDVSAVQRAIAAAVPAATAALAAAALPSGVAPTEGDLVDPGPGVQLCFDYINNGSCTRLRTGQGCKYRHLAPHHPDVIADKIRQGKLNPAAAAQILQSGVGAPVPGLGAGAGAGLAGGLIQSVLAGAAAPPAPVPPAGQIGVPPDPGPGNQLCFDFVNRCVRVLVTVLACPPCPA